MKRPLPLWAVLVLVPVVGLAAGGGGVAAGIYYGNEGPQGPPGPRGTQGPAGQGADEALSRADDLEAQVSDLQDTLSNAGLDSGYGRFGNVDVADLQNRVDDLELSVQNLSDTIDSICLTDPRITCY